MVDEEEVRRLLADHDRRDEGLQALAKGNYPWAASAARNHLGDVEQLVRQAALECLIAHGDETDLPHAVSALADESYLVRITAIEFILDWGSSSEAGALVRCLDDPSELVRAYAASALGQLGADDVRLAVLTALAAEERRIARAGMLEAALALGADIALLAELESLVRDEDLAIACFAVRSLGNLRSVSTRVSIGAAEALVRAREIEGRPLVREVILEELKPED